MTIFFLFKYLYFGVVASAFTFLPSSIIVKPLSSGKTLKRNVNPTSIPRSIVVCTQRSSSKRDHHELEGRLKSIFHNICSKPTNFDSSKQGTSIRSSATFMPEFLEDSKAKVVENDLRNIEVNDDDFLSPPTATATSPQNPNTSPKNQSAIQSLLWKASIIVLCALWASNFPVAKLIMSEPGVTSSLYTVARFGTAALALLPGSIAVSRQNSLDWSTAKSAAICGAWVAFGYIGQTVGLLTTTASKSCVICSLNCIFVAVVAELKRISSSGESGETAADFDYGRLLPALVAVAGVAIIELKGDIAPTVGDLLSFAQPIGFGMGYIQLEEIMAQSPENGLPVSAIKLSMVSLASLGLFGFTSSSMQIPDLTPILSSPVALGGIAYTGLVTTALALWFESIAFKRVPATDVSIILSTEPLFAAGLAALCLGETFGISDYVGAALIVGACVMAVLQDDGSHA